MSSVPAVLLAAGTVGLAHSVLPDHWVPLAVLARTRRDPLPRVARLSALAGVAHVTVSLLLGAIVALIGLSFRHAIESRTNLVVGGVLVLTGIGFLIAELTGHGHHHPAGHEHGDGHQHQHGHGPGHEHHDDDAHQGQVMPSGFALLVPFGAAASPDLTILPVFLAAATLGVSAALGALAIFTAVTVGTFVALTTGAAAGGYQIRGAWLDRYANVITAVVLLVLGGLIAGQLL